MKINIKEGPDVGACLNKTDGVLHSIELGLTSQLFPLQLLQVPTHKLLKKDSNVRLCDGEQKTEKVS